MNHGLPRMSLQRCFSGLSGVLRSMLLWWERQPHHVPAAVMLLTIWLVFYAWVYVPDALQAEAWNMGGALGRIVLLGLVVLAYRSLPVTAAALWWCFEDAQVVGCGVLWMFAPWPVDTGGGRCSDLLGWPLGMVGISLGSAAAWVVFRQANFVREP